MCDLQEACLELELIASGYSLNPSVETCDKHALITEMSCRAVCSSGELVDANISDVEPYNSADR